MTESNTELAVVSNSKELVEKPSLDRNLEQLASLITTGDISKMTKVQKDQFLVDLARVMKLNPWPPPFTLIPGQNGKEIIYANKSCADQLRKTYNISIEITYQGPFMLGETANPDVYCVRAKATMLDSNGSIRTDEEVGAVSIKGLAGEALSNAIMKASTKAKRRVTYAISGLALMDETEVQDMSRAGYNNGPKQFLPPSQPKPGLTVEVIESGAPKVPVEVK